MEAMERSTLQSDDLDSVTNACLNKMDQRIRMQMRNSENEGICVTVEGGDSLEKEEESVFVTEDGSELIGNLPKFSGFSSANSDVFSESYSDDWMQDNANDNIPNCDGVTGVTGEDIFSVLCLDDENDAPSFG